MTGSSVLLAVAGASALADWVAVAPGVSMRRLEWAAKPATLATLVAAAATIAPAGATQRGWFLAALALSLAGDVFLMLPRERFVAGLGSFLAAHLCYSAGLFPERTSDAAVVAGAAIVLPPAAILGRRLVAGARGAAPRLAVPVAAYVTAIAAMTSIAIATRDALATAGALLFMTSDALLGWNRFVAPLRWSRPAVMATYHLAQAAFVLSLAR